MSIFWKAIYEDNTELSQYNVDGSENKYTAIDRSKLSKFLLLEGYIDLEGHWAEKLPKIILHLDKNKRLICRKRVAVEVGRRRSEEFIWLVGWQENKEGMNVQMICALFQDGHIEIVDKFKEGHPWFYPVILLPEER